MAFDIRFLQAEPSRPGVILGAIELDEFREQFEVELSFWDTNAYEAQWREGVTRILTGASRSCLITSISNPATANFITWWPLYRRQQVVLVRNQILFMDQVDRVFDAADPYAHVPQREVMSTEGTPISEWSVNVAELEHWKKQWQQ